jgi:hypothetical protein
MGEAFTLPITSRNVIDAATDTGVPAREKMRWTKELSHKGEGVKMTFFPARRVDGVIG